MKEFGLTFQKVNLIGFHKNGGIDYVSADSHTFELGAIQYKTYGFYFAETGELIKRGPGTATLPNGQTLYSDEDIDIFTDNYSRTFITLKPVQRYSSDTEEERELNKIKVGDETYESKTVDSVRLNADEGYVLSISFAEPQIRENETVTAVHFDRNGKVLSYTRDKPLIDAESRENWMVYPD